MSDSDSDAGVPLREPMSPSASPKRGASGKTSTASKRKRVAESEEPELEDVDSDAGTAAKAANASKKQKKKQKKSKKEVARDEALDEKLGVNHALAHMDGQLLADHIAQRLRRFEGEKISGIEEEELRVPGKRARRREMNDACTPSNTAHPQPRQSKTPPHGPKTAPCPPSPTS